MNILSEVWRIFSYIIFAITLYSLCISFFGIYIKKQRHLYDPQKSFALIVAAHNEEKVIEDMVKSLKKIDYPKNLYDIYVIADNCTDSTAAKARGVGALVYERSNKGKKGKGYALEWMFNKLFKLSKKYDSVVIFDADNIVSKNFLRAMNNKLCDGYKVVQGYLDSKNPGDTWITCCYSIAFWSSNRLIQLSRSNIGLSSQLGGTGICIDTQVLEKLGWGATCLTEDLEFTCKLVLNGLKVGWAHDAVIYDEKPLTLKQSCWQRKRWMQGFADVSSRYFFKLMKRAITKHDFVAFDCALYSIQPITIILFCISAIVGAGVYVFKAFYSVSAFIANFSAGAYSVNFTAAKIFLIVFGILQFIFTPFVLKMDKKLTFKMFIYYVFAYPIYTITWLPVTIMGIANKNKKEWNHTEHTRSISIDEMEKAN